MEQVVQETFDNTAWVFASADLCKSERIFPNTLAYNASDATLAVFVKRSSGGDFALSQGGLDYLLRLVQGALKDGSPVRQAIVVLADGDARQRYKPVKQFSAEEIRDRFKGIEPVDGKFGRYWWLPASAYDDGPKP
jgi:hypothetical protein